MNSTTVQEIPVSSIIAGDNDRKTFDQADLIALAQSIAKNGLAQPITVRPFEGGFQVVAGERRLRAHILLKMPTIKALVEQMDDERASAIMLAENTGRIDLDPIEEARAYFKRTEAGETVETVAEIAGVGVDRVKRRISLLGVDSKLSSFIASGELPIGHAEILAKTPNEVQWAAWRIFVRSGRGISLNHFRKACTDLEASYSQGSLLDMETFWADEAEKMSNLPTRGKQARIRTPIREDLPTVRYYPGDSAGAITERFAEDLISAGFATEAATIGTLFQALVNSNYMQIPLGRKR